MTIKTEVWSGTMNKSLEDIFKEIVQDSKTFPLMSIRALRRDAVYKYWLDFDAEKQLEEMTNIYIDSEEEITETPEDTTSELASDLRRDV